MKARSGEGGVDRLALKEREERALTIVRDAGWVPVNKAWLEELKAKAEAAAPQPSEPGGGD